MTRPPDYPTTPQSRTGPVRDCLPLHTVPLTPPQRRCPGPPPAPFIGIERGPSRPTALTPCSNPKAAPHRWIRAKDPSTLGTFLRSFRWGYVRQLNRVSRQLLARAWAAGAGPGESPLTIDLDSTICETYGLAKEGARHHGYTGARGYHPLLAIAAGTGEVLMSRRAAEVKVMVDEFPQAQVPGEGGWQEQAGIGHQAMVVKEDADTVGIVLWQHLLGAPCFRAGFCSKIIIPD